MNTFIALAAFGWLSTAFTLYQWVVTDHRLSKARKEIASRDIDFDANDIKAGLTGEAQSLNSGPTIL